MSARLRIGSLFSGYGGLDMAVAAHYGATVAWHCEFDKHPSAILAHRYPDIPNHHDVTSVDWSAVEPVDIITGGFPCQDVSHAGLRAGVHQGTRSGLWFEMARAIDALQPRKVVIENVAGLLSADAACNVEPCPWCVGDEPEGHMRALGAVLADLAEMGFDADWGSVRAADAGAPHGRLRVFIVATARNASGRWARDDGPRRWEQGRHELERADIPTAADAGGGQLPRPAERIDGLPVAGERGGDADGLTLLPTPRAQDSDESPTTFDRRVGALQSAEGRSGGRTGTPLGVEVQRHIDFGPYAAAIARWGQVLGRPAPPPTEPGMDGRPRLSPRFVEFMMGLPDGWVTGVDIPRSAQLKALGNGVVKQQAALALALLDGAS